MIGPDIDFKFGQFWVIFCCLDFAETTNLQCFQHKFAFLSLPQKDRNTISNILFSFVDLFLLGMKKTPNDKVQEKQTKSRQQNPNKQTI